MPQETAPDFKDSLKLIFDYAKVRVIEQAKSIAFIISYLVLFQLLILRVPLEDALATAGGLALVVFGLAFFLEGLVLGLMPIGERVGVKLPTKAGIIVICLFGIVLGFGATFAEPAISALKLAGSTITAWDSPLLFLILERYSEVLVICVGTGVGLAVALGLCRFYYSWAMKPIIYAVLPVLLALTLFASFDDNLSKIIGLAWDCGAVTTGAVTVPLVLALGIGVSRAASKGSSSGGGFGIILLASLFPVLAVLLLGMVINTHVPKPATEKDFFSAAGRTEALKVFNSEEEIVQHLFTRGTEEGRMAFFGDEFSYSAAIKSLAENTDNRKRFLGSFPLNKWILNKASDNERNLLADVNLTENSLESGQTIEVLQGEAVAGLQAVIPLTLLLLLVLILFLREKLKYKDEVALGIAFTVFGMTLLTSGIQLGLGSLGNEVGSHLPKAFAKEEKFIDRVVINDFDSTLLYKAVSVSGIQKTFFNVYDQIYDREIVRPIEFEPVRYDSANKRYVHAIVEQPLFDHKYYALGFVVVLLFAFGMGYGATLAEPALNALGMTVEELTVGALKRKQIVQVVSIGVAAGITLGLSRILFGYPLVFILVPSYLILLVLTYLSEDEFSAIAWDSGGVTTGPVTVPLVLAMGLGIGNELSVSDGFGILAMASAFPVITVLTFGILSKKKQKENLDTNSK